MAPAKPVADQHRKYFSVEEANRSLPLVRAIVEDIVRQSRVVDGLQQRLQRVLRERRRPSDDLYSEELAQTQNELEARGGKAPVLCRRTPEPWGRAQERRDRSLRFPEHHERA